LSQFQSSLSEGAKKANKKFMVYRGYKKLKTKIDESIWIVSDAVCHR
jgi:hypothetical protein